MSTGTIKMRKGAASLLAATLAVGVAPVAAPALAPQLSGEFTAYAAAEAITVSIDSSETYTLDADKLVSSVDIKGDIDVTVDLAGHTLTLNSKSFRVSDGARVTVKNGTIRDELPAPEQENSVNSTFFVSGKGSTLMLGEGVTVDGKACALYASDGAAVTVDGAAVSSQDTAATVYAVGEGSSFRFVSGNIASSKGSAAACYDGAKLSIEDGVVYAPERNVIQTGAGDGFTAGEISVNGGEFFGNKDYAIVSCPEGMTPVTGGVFHGALGTSRVKSDVSAMRLEDVDGDIVYYVGESLSALNIATEDIAYVVQSSGATVRVGSIEPGATILAVGDVNATVTDGTTSKKASTSYLDVVKDLKGQLAEALKPDPAKEAEQQAALDELETRLVKASAPGSLSAKAQKGKKIAVSWKAPAYTDVDGYSVEYKLKSAKKWTVKDAGTKTKLTLAKLKAGKAYQVRVQGYKTVGSEKVGTGYTAVKTVKPKK